MTAQQPPRLLRAFPGSAQVAQGFRFAGSAEGNRPAYSCRSIRGGRGPQWLRQSTLLRLLAGLDKASGGELLAGSAPLSEAIEDTRLMFQEARLLPWKKIIDNVGLGLKGNWRPQALEALEAVGLAERANEWPAALSGGQKQRVALARALIHQPRLLLLDEPLGALDALTRIEMQQLIENLWQKHGFTVLLVTHDVSEAVAIADRVIFDRRRRNRPRPARGTPTSAGAWLPPPGGAGNRSA